MDVVDGSGGSRGPSPVPQEPPLDLYNYIPLLDDCEDLFPEYKLRVAHVEKKLKAKPKVIAPVVAKSPSPAGKKPKKRSSSKKRST